MAGLSEPSRPPGKYLISPAAEWNPSPFLSFGMLYMLLIYSSVFIHFSQLPMNRFVSGVFDNLLEPEGQSIAKS